MQFAFTPEQQEFRQVLRRFFEPLRWFFSATSAMSSTFAPLRAA